MDITQNQLPQKIDNIDLLRSFGIGLVVLRHCFAPFTGSWSVGEFYEFNESANIFDRYISTLSMPLFVFISGFTFSYLRNYLHKYPTYSNLVHKKTKRLLVPYLFLALLYILLFIDFSSFGDFVKQMLRGPGHLWFLLMIYILLLGFYRFENTLKTRVFLGIGVGLFLFSSSLLMHKIGLPIIGYVFKYVLFFYIGYLFHFKNLQIRAFIKNKFYYTFLIHLSLFVLYIYLLNIFENDTLKIIFAHFALIPLGILSITFTYLIFEKIENKISIKNRNHLKIINTNSYYLYLIDQALLKVFFGISFIQILPVSLVIPLAFIIGFQVSNLLGGLILKTRVGRLLINS